MRIKPVKQPKPTIINESELELSIDEMQSLLLTTSAAQGTEEWFEDRLGKATASHAKDVVSRDRYGKPYKSYYDYIIQLAIERVTAKQLRFSNKFTAHGNEYEGYVAQLYEDAYPERDVRETEFIEHPTLAAGASLDRLVDDDGDIEIKAPNSATLVRYMISMIPEDDPNYELVKILGLSGNEWKFYYEQIQWQLWISGRKWCDFCVGDPDMPENAQLIIKRVPRNDVYINDVIKPRAIEFLAKVDRLERYLLEYHLGVTAE
jgi:hypothetical protein